MFLTYFHLILVDIKDNLFKIKNVKSTEEYLNTMSPPIHACAVSDKLGNKIHEFATRLYEIRNIVNNFDLSQLSKEEYMIHVLQFDKYREYVSQSIEKCEKALDDIENIRSACLNVRSSVRSLKFDFYDLISKDLKIELSEENINKVKYFPQSSIEIEFLTQKLIIESFIFNIKIPGVSEIEGIEIDISLIGNIYLDLLKWANELSIKMIEKIKSSNI